MASLAREDMAGLIREPGVKPVVHGKIAVGSSDNGIVTETILNVLREGGTAVDAGIAAALLQGTIAPHMTNMGGTVTFLFHEAKTGTLHQMSSTGAFPAGVPAAQVVPPGVGGFYSYPTGTAFALIPGFMPGIRDIFSRFATMPWSRLMEPALYWSENGHPVSAFEYGVRVQGLPFTNYLPEGRRMLLRDGFLVPAGGRFRNPELTRTLRRLEAEGPDHFITGEWAEHFVARANELGWPIGMAHMQNPPRWGEASRFTYGDCEVRQLALPHRQGVFCPLVLGVLRELGIEGMDPLGPEAIFWKGHVMRWADCELAYVNDPEHFDVPEALWRDPDYHRRIARILRAAVPTRDLEAHVTATMSHVARIAAGIGPRQEPPTGSCELSIVDRHGNWVQMMNTLQIGGIPGAVVDGVAMVGGNVALGVMDSPLSGWLLPGARERFCLPNTIVYRGGEPVLSLGSPGNVHYSVLQVLSYVLQSGFQPHEAAIAPRMLAISDTSVLPIEDRLSTETHAGLRRMGVRVHPLDAFDWHMGSYQMSWREPETGLLGSFADYRRAGVAGGIAPDEI